VPEEVAFRGKDAAQHGANVHDAIYEIAEQDGLTAGELAGSPYDPARSVTEKLGSSSRYGYKYGDAKLWEPPAHVQFHLDGIAAEIGLLNGDARENWEATARSLEKSASQGG